jgi:electron transfer flavoprotein beta subunit
MKIIALVKQVPDTWGDRALDLATGLLDRVGSDAVFDEIDERAVEIALQTKESLGGEVVVMTMGPEPSKDVLRKSLAMGVDSAVHIVSDQLAGSDIARTSAVLADAIRAQGFDLVVAGNESTDGRGGVVPAMIAEHLAVPHLTFLDEVDVQETTVSGRRSVEYGALAVHAALPAVISITERSADARFPSFSGIMKAKKKPLEQLAAFAAASGGRSVVTSTEQRPLRASGIKIVDEGDAGHKLAEFLVAQHLV